MVRAEISLRCSFGVDGNRGRSDRSSAVPYPPANILVEPRSLLGREAGLPFFGPSTGQKDMTNDGFYLLVIHIFGPG